MRRVSLRTCCHYMCSPDEKTTSEQCDYKVSGLEVYGTDAALECGSQNALTSHRRAQKGTHSCQRHISDTTVIITQHVHVPTYKETKNVEGVTRRRLKNTQKDAHVEHTHTHKAAGIL